MTPVSSIMPYQIKVDVFEGPFDLLLYLIKKNEMDIYTVSLSEITSHYLDYILAMQEMDLEIAGEFLVIAATLIYIKSQRLLPPSEDLEADEELEMTEADLLERLQEYQKFKELGSRLWQLAERRQLLYTREESIPEIDSMTEIPMNVTLNDLILSYRDMSRFIIPAGLREVAHDEVTVEQKIEMLNELVGQQQLIHFSQLRGEMKNNLELVVTLLALLELCRLKHVSIDQPDIFGEIFISKYKNLLAGLSLGDLPVLPDPDSHPDRNTLPNE